ncbi:AT DNA binding protein [Histoplasma capsulatum H143]|uniref:Thymocyte nuclear protein 1 n=1 Tax=Ajellomyces capsulatus (strain H143) TaxID=544712 RepID=C6H280_AJECH|nr:AT DNA binding protein [Histoplasma capsulatum H143]
MPPKRQKHRAVSSSNANEPSQKNVKKPRLNPRKPAAPVVEESPSSESEPGVTHIAKESPASGPSERAEKRAGGANTVNTEREKVTKQNTKSVQSASKKSKQRESRPALAANDTKTEPKNKKTIDETRDEEDGSKSYWLMKAEPESRMEKGVDVKFSIDDLREASEPEAWDGVRNPTARNNMRAMKKGDLAFFYHSNCKVPGIAGIMEIVREHSVDESAFDPAHPYYDPKSSRENPKWEVVHVEFRRKFKDLITLAELKSFAKPGGPLENMQMMKQSRLSVSVVGGKEWEFIMGLAGEE